MTLTRNPQPHTATTTQNTPKRPETNPRTGGVRNESIMTAAIITPGNENVRGAGVPNEPSPKIGHFSSTPAHPQYNKTIHLPPPPGVYPVLRSR
jgi:hypothetical protein